VEKAVNRYVLLDSWYHALVTASRERLGERPASA
jgi:hypothetical protein